MGKDLEIRCDRCHTFIARVHPLTYSGGDWVIGLRVTLRCPNNNCMNHKKPHNSVTEVTIAHQDAAKNSAKHILTPKPVAV